MYEILMNFIKSGCALTSEFVIAGCIFTGFTRFTFRIVSTCYWQDPRNMDDDLPVRISVMGIHLSFG